MNLNELYIYSIKHKWSDLLDDLRTIENEKDAILEFRRKFNSKCIFCADSTNSVKELFDDEHFFFDCDTCRIDKTLCNVEGVND